MREEAITSDQMYKIEENGHKLLGMRRIYMMENAGHGVADFIVSKFKSQSSREEDCRCLRNW